MELADWKEHILQAEGRIKDLVRKTPLEPSPVLGELGEAKVYIKLESEQVTGSFKVRGACNKISLLNETSEDFRKKGSITASTGNHAMACNYALGKLGMTGTMYVPSTISASKSDALKRSGAHVVVCGDDCVAAETGARKAAEEEGRPYISPYNDRDVVAGQGTIGLEILDQLPDVDVVLVPVGGGGLIGGIAAYIKACKPDVKIVGCQPLLSKVMLESIKAGKIIYEDSGDTLSDGTAGGIEEGAITFQMCRDYVDEWVLVNEEEIAKAVYFMVEQHHKIVEGAAGLSIGAFLKEAKKYKGLNVVIVACGANISIDKLKEIINRYSK